MEDSPPSSMLELTTPGFNSDHIFPICNSIREYNPTNISLEWDFSYWASQVKNLLWRVESLKTENKQLHSEVTDLKNIVSKMKQEKNMHLQTTSTDSPLLQTKLNNLQEELKLQQALLKQET